MTQGRPMAKLQIDIPESHFTALKATYPRKGQLTQVIRILIQRHVAKYNLVPETTASQESLDVVSSLVDASSPSHDPQS